VSDFRALFFFGFILFLSCIAAAQRIALETPFRSPHGDKLKIECQECHTTQGWKPLRAKLEFNHSHTKFPLRGRHTEVQCADCHQTLIFSNTPIKCQNCHADLHRRKNGAECELCHNPNGWQVSIHNINEHQDRFPLIGAHAAVDCYSCHKVGTVGQFNRFGLSTECVSCHMAAFRKTTAPNHQAQGFSTECQQCHLSMDSWYGATLVRRGSAK
jgi:ribosomal protein S27E